MGTWATVRCAGCHSRRCPSVRARRRASASGGWPGHTGRRRTCLLWQGGSPTTVPAPAGRAREPNGPSPWANQPPFPAPTFVRRKGLPSHPTRRPVAVPNLLAQRPASPPGPNGTGAAARSLGKAGPLGPGRRRVRPNSLCQDGSPSRRNRRQAQEAEAAMTNRLMTMTKRLDAVSDEERTKLMALARPVTFLEDEQIFQEHGIADHFWLLRDGEVQLELRVPGSAA